MADDDTPTIPHIDWWRDGRVIIQLVTLVLGFGGTWLTMYYQASLTREKVERVEHRQDENANVVKEAAQDSAAVRSIIVGDK